MAKVSSKDITVFALGGYRLKGFATSVNHSHELSTEQSDVLGDNWTYHDSVGFHNVSLQQQGFFTTEEAGSNEAFATSIANGVAVPGCLAFGTIGSLAHMYRAPMQANFEITAARGELAKASASYNGAGEFSSGVLLLDNNAIAQAGIPAGSATSYDGTAGSSAGFWAVVQVPEITLDGATNLVVKIQDSTDDAIWADLHTFTAVTADHAFEVGSGTGTVDRYLRVLAEWTGVAGASATADVIVAFYRR